MSKLSFRARALDCARPLCVWLAEELPEPPDASAISRAVPALPSGMEKEEECEHHLQRAICTGLIIPTPEVSDTADLDFYERCYPADYKMPRQLIHMQPLCLEQETPEYDMDSEDERWLRQQRRAELTELKFEEMMDRLERSSGQTVVTLSEAKLLLERQDDLVIAVYDYWLNKRLKTQHPLILSVRTENRVGQSANNPYLAFRRRTEKMQTRKNRKNDESSYEKMLKLRRDLSRAATLLELVARRERAKRELVRLTALLAERRFTHGDYAGQLVDDVHASAPLRSSFQPVALSTGSSGAGFRREGLGYAGSHYAPRPGHGGVDQPRLREKRQYKRRKHRHHGSGSALREGGVYSSSEEEVALPVLVSGAPAAGAAGAGTEPLTPVEATPVPPVDDGPFAFRRKAGVYYQAPTPMLGEDYEAPVSPAGKESRHSKDKRFRFTLTSINHPYPKCIGFARRRLGRGGRVVLDRISTPLDDLWPLLHYRFPDSTSRRPHDDTDTVGEHRRHRYPAETSKDYHSGGKYSWRHAFRQHCANNPTLWTSSDVKREKAELDSAVKLDSGLSDQKHDQSLPDYKYVPSITTALKCDEGLPSDHKYAVSEVTDKCEPMDLDSVLPQDLNKLNGDISCSRRGVEASVRASLARQVRVRGRARRRSSDSSCEGAPLEPREREFAAFVEQVNTEWLHFRPKTPPAEPPRVPEDTDRLPLTADTPIAVELRLGAHDPPSKALLEDSSPFTTSEFTLADLYGDSLLNVDPGESSGSLDASGDDSSLLADHFSGLTDAQVESILSDTDLKALADDDKKNSIDLLKPDDADAILEELVKGEVNGKSEDPFLLSGQSAAGRGTLGASAAYSGHKRRKKAPKFTDFGSSVVTVTPIEDDEAIYVDLIPPPPPELPKTSTPITKILEPAPLPKKPIEKPPVKEELKAEPKRKLAKEEVIEDVQLAQGVQLKTVQTKHSPLKKHIITSAAHRRNTDSMTLVTSQDAAQTQPQIVTVAVSESLKMRLQNHLLANQQQGLVTIDGSSLQTSGATVVGLVQNGPFTVSSAGGVAMAVPASVSMATVSREGTVSVAGIASTSSPRRVSTPLVHLTPAALHQKQLQQISHQPPVVVAHPHTLQHNKLKVLHAHTLTQSQRTQLLAQSRAAGITQLPAVVSLSTLGETKSTPTTALQLKAAPGSVAQFFEIKSGQLGKGPHLVNVVRQPQPGKTTVARLDLNDAKKRTQVVATFDGTLKGNIARATTPHRLSVSLDGRHLVRAALPTVRAHPVRHPIQLKNRTLVATSQQQASTSITIAAPSKTTSLPNSVVANLLQKNAMAKGGQKIAIAGGTQGLANVQAFTAFTHAQQLKARQARLVAQPRPNQTADIVDATPTTSGAAPTGDTTDPSDGTNGSVRRRPAETLPMEVT